MEKMINSTATQVPLVVFEWDTLPLEERRRRVEIRKKNMGLFKDIVTINDPKLRGEA